jgi:hypothetical protein
MRRAGHRQTTRTAASRATARVVVFACAASAGAHAGLVPEHLRESPRLGAAFVVSAVLLAIAGATFAIRPDNTRIAQATALLLAGLIVAYAADRTTGIPLLAPEPEAADAVGLATKLVEAAGLACALWLSQPAGGHRPSAS